MYFVGWHKGQPTQNIFKFWRLTKIADGPHISSLGYQCLIWSFRQKYVKYEATFWGFFALLMLVYKKNVYLIFTNIHVF